MLTQANGYERRRRIALVNALLDERDLRSTALRE